MDTDPPDDESTDRNAVHELSTEDESEAEQLFEPALPSDNLILNNSNLTFHELSTEDESEAEQLFDPALTTEHSYLGSEMEVLRGRTLLDDGICFRLPIILQKSMVLFPEQTLPMVAHDTPTVNMLRSCIVGNGTFGVVRTRMEKDPLYGTTAEIQEYSDNGLRGVRIKARGQQRFKVLRLVESQGQVHADVRILPEVVLGPPLYEVRLASLDNLRKIPENEKEANEQEMRISRRDSAVSPWPSWVYRQYDVRLLTMKIHEQLRFVAARGSVIPKEPVELSFWLAQNLSLSVAARMFLLRDNCALSRLQYAAEALSTFGGKSFVCAKCRCPIGKHKDIVPMTKKGLQEAYCNPYGAIHETVTLYKATNVVLNREPPSTVCSWFPGYAWTIACCRRCSSHVGWLFSAVHKDLKPPKFWGLTRNNLILKYVLFNNDEMSSSNSMTEESETREPPRFHSLSDTENENDDDNDGDDEGDNFDLMRQRVGDDY